MYKTKQVRAEMQVIERIAAHYDTQEVEFGRIYRWCPECIVVECDCSERMTLKRLDIIIDSGVICEECGAKVSPRIREEVVIELLDEDYVAIHPWHHDAQAQAEQHLRDEAAYPEDSPWRFDDVTLGFVGDDEERWKKARARQTRPISFTV
ncbi:MAG: hypothetical protein H0T57_17795 [Rubrobacter sp.]|nr:hypothetical protein [Rubrobacter sp.]